MTCPNRRGFLEGVLAASAMQLTPMLASAASPTSHAFRFGEFDITVFSDGQLTVPTRFLASNVSEADIKTWLGTTAAIVTPATNSVSRPGGSPWTPLQRRWIVITRCTG